MVLTNISRKIVAFKACNFKSVYKYRHPTPPSLNPETLAWTSATGSCFFLFLCIAVMLRLNRRDLLDAGRPESTL
jgi:hypothetical protein